MEKQCSRKNARDSKPASKAIRITDSGTCAGDKRVHGKVDVSPAARKYDICGQASMYFVPCPAASGKKLRGEFHFILADDTRQTSSISKYQ